MQWSDVEGRHVVLTAALVVVVDYILAHIVIRSRVLDVGLMPSIVHDKDQDEGCTLGVGGRERRRVLEFSLIWAESNLRFYTASSLGLERREEGSA